MNDDTGRRELYLPFGAGTYVLRYRIDSHSVYWATPWSMLVF